MKYSFISLFGVALLWLLPNVSKAQQQAAAKSEADKNLQRAMQIVCPKSDDICKLLKELQIKVTRFRKQEVMEDTEGLFANVEGIKYVFGLIDKRYQAMTVKPLELTHFLQSKYSFIVIYLHSYLDKYRRQMLASIEQSWLERKQLFSRIKQETANAQPNQEHMSAHKTKLVKTYQKLINQNQELKDLYETLVPVYTELATQDANVKKNLKELNEQIATQTFLLRKLKQDLERIPR